MVASGLGRECAHRQRDVQRLLVSRHAVDTAGHGGDRLEPAANSRGERRAVGGRADHRDKRVQVNRDDDSVRACSIRRGQDAAAWPNLVAGPSRHRLPSTRSSGRPALRAMAAAQTTSHFIHGVSCSSSMGKASSKSWRMSCTLSKTTTKAAIWSQWTARMLLHQRCPPGRGRRRRG
jgi:hypothetical protein